MNYAFARRVNHILIKIFVFFRNNRRFWRCVGAIVEHGHEESMHSGKPSAEEFITCTVEFALAERPGPAWFCSSYPNFLLTGLPYLRHSLTFKNKGGQYQRKFIISVTHRFFEECKPGSFKHLIAAKATRMSFHVERAWLNYEIKGINTRGGFEV